MRVEINKITGTKESKPSDIRICPTTDWTVNNWEKWKEGIEFNVDYLRQQPRQQQSFNVEKYSELILILYYNPLLY